MLLGLLLVLLLAGLPLPAFGAVLCETSAATESAESPETERATLASLADPGQTAPRAHAAGSRCDVQWPPRLHPRPAPSPLSDHGPGDAALMSHAPGDPKSLRSGTDSLLLPTLPSLMKPLPVGLTASRASPLRCSQTDPARLDRPPR